MDNQQPRGIKSIWANRSPKIYALIHLSEKAMKNKIHKMMMLAMLATALLTFTSCSSTPESPPAVGTARITYAKGVPGGVLVQTMKIAATVAATDQAKRLATLQATDGKEFKVMIGREVANFDQIRVGDKVNAIVTQKVRITLDDKEPAASDSTPGNPAAEAMQLTARIMVINPEKRTVTLQFENGRTETVSIREDIDPSRHKVGDQITFRITEMVASQLERLQ